MTSRTRPDATVATWRLNERTASPDVPFRNGLFTFFTTDSNGNYTSNITGWVSGSDPTLKTLETVFHQDFNGNGVIGSTIASPAAAADPDSTSRSFTGSTLTLEASSTLYGQIVGFAGDGMLQGSDQIDLRNLNFNSIHSAYDDPTGILEVTDGSNTANIQFIESYSQDSFRFADDGDAGGVVYVQTGSSQPSSPSNNGATIQVAGNNVPTAAQDTFIFASNFGQATISNFVPTTDTIEVSKTVFANIGALLAATHDDQHDNAVITDATHDTITIQNVTTAQLQAHQSAFYFV